MKEKEKIVTIMLLKLRKKYSEMRKFIIKKLIVIVF